MNRRDFVTITSVVSSLISLTGCQKVSGLAATFTDKRTEFSKVETGLNGATREQVLVLLGTPDSSSVTSFAGLDGEVLTFRDAVNHYSVRLVNQRAWAKSSAPLQSSTTLEH